MRALGLFLGLTFLLAPGRQASAATITVDDLTDSSGGLTCTLRDAITAANTNAAAGSCPAGDPGADTIAFSVNGMITLNSQLPAIAEDVAIEGPGASKLTVSGNHAVQVMGVNVGVTVHLHALTIADGGTDSNGNGGGIVNFGTLTVRDSTFSGNSSLGGGGIYNLGTLTVRRSTFSGNAAHSCFFCIAGQGGGIFNYKLGTLTVRNSTFSDNTAGLGGGIYNDGTMEVTNCTMAGNSADGAGVFNGEGTLTIANSIFANNTPSNCGGFTAVTGGADNLSDDATCSGFTVANPLLGPLQVYPPGTTATFALLAGSPALDAGNDVTCPATDQRGVSRPQGMHCDIGAFEQQMGSTTLVRGSALMLRDDSLPPIMVDTRSITFRSAKYQNVASGVAPAAWGSAGDPTSAGIIGGATLIVYNANGSGEKVIVNLPAARWKKVGTSTNQRGYRYSDPQRLSGPVLSVSVTSAGMLSLTGRGSSWLFTLNEPSQVSVAVRLRLGSGDGWCAVFPAKPSPTGANDRIDTFVGAPNLPIPASCPAVP